MIDATLLFNITPIPLLSVLVWIVLVLTALLLARHPFKEVMASLGRSIYQSGRIAATAVRLAEKQLKARNRQIRLAADLTRAERQVEREFERIGAAVERSQITVPSLQRNINGQLDKLKNDYQKSADIPQGLSDWVRVIDAIAGIRPPVDPMAATILENIHSTLKKQHHVALNGHRQAVSQRHRVLAGMLPQWRKTEKRLKGIETATLVLSSRAERVDRCMADYEAIRTNTDSSERSLSASALTRFFAAALVLGIFAIGVIVNFNLIALPMSEMVGANSYIGSFNTADVAGFFLVGVQVVVGIFLMDTLCITRLFPMLGGLDERQRTWFFWSLLASLIVLAGIDAALVLIRDRMIMDMEILKQSLAGLDPDQAVTQTLPTVGRMALGFVLPFILATAAIPLEAFIATSRILLGLLGEFLLRAVATLLHLGGSVGRLLTTVLVKTYDLFIFPALWAEALIVRKIADKTRLRRRPHLIPTLKNQTVPMTEGRMACKKSID
ncbi:hypothetical protein [Desulfosarcina ovata]|uniref:Uncharacterized protein n=1 Tax=Desulfosarcina ovata subsp. ovata TaxID=2752305 RepID=A0A5K8A5B5_9BACT|nr:hypothetical protein [Desulfosarcina ovata]BBO87701.1 hypothetical protein DSCOOX_08810 [Desulfosarcina ovata subsp. ovata]